VERNWDAVVESLRDDRIPAAHPNADLLDQAKARWDGQVVPRASHLDLLFTLPSDPYPFERTVSVSHSEGVFEFQLHDSRGFHLVTADRATRETAPAVLDAFLMQLTGT